MEVVNFKVDTKLTSILGESYRSTEYALKELIDNSWDADSESVKITLPEPLTKDPVIIEDKGSGMTEKEIQSEYLVIASSRLSRKGERTPVKNRLVKGRKGIGKFAGLVIANEMTVISHARGKKTTITIKKDELLKSEKDLGSVDIPIFVEECDSEEKGTTIILSELNENFSFPDPETFKQILIIDYGRSDNFKIIVNETNLDVSDIPGETIETGNHLNSIGAYRAKFTISESKKKLRQPGLAIRVNGKIIGKPSFLGLENVDAVPRKLLNKVYGEIEADGLEKDVTADWGAIIENSTGYQDLVKDILPKIKAALNKAFQKDVEVQQGRIKKRITRELNRLPEHKRFFVHKSLDKIIKNFYNEDEEKLNTIISVVMDAYEKDEYWVALSDIAESEDSDLVQYSSALSRFGFAEMALNSQQAASRLKFLEYFRKLIENPNTTEKDIHRGLEKNLWLFGNEYSSMSSNETLTTIVTKYAENKFSGEHESKRPDLLLSQDLSDRFLLVEFKKPNHVITRDHEENAMKYRDEIRGLINKEIEVLIIGGNVDPKIANRPKQVGLTLLGFNDVLSVAERQLNGLVEELSSIMN